MIKSLLVFYQLNHQLSVKFVQYLTLLSFCFEYFYQIKTGQYI